MEENNSLLKNQINIQYGKASNNTCQSCGQEFERPLFTVVSSNYIEEEGYYACPKCLSKIECQPSTDADYEEETESSNQSELTPENIVENESPSVPASCPHYVGYLKKRAKDTPVPEECFTCSEMINCMSN
jgi:DNA-directed RNA polymerase subunit RPC12/RpoP